VPSITLLEAFDRNANPRLAAAEAGSPLAAVALSAAEKETLLSRIDGQRLAGHVERYSGVRQTSSGGTLIHSRHIHHAGNAEAVEMLVGDLQRIGAGRLVVRRYRFSHEGRSLESVEGELPGSGLDGIVLVTAHGAPRRTARFVLFNAEEHGLVGSGAYARNQAADGVPIVAVFQMDMIGFDVVPDRTFELHAGFTPSASVQARSLGLAHTVADLRPQVSPHLPAPQIYPADGRGDPAESRSDHYSFQFQGYAACLASEDLFPGPGSGAPQGEPNPNYHLPTDTVVNAAYAADIARLRTAAAWVAATR
jgi:bacterial leucyl aminopeptidase